jgi:hypothetical protein
MAGLANEAVSHNERRRDGAPRRLPATPLAT